MNASVATPDPITAAEFLRAPALHAVRHGFFTRRGGVSAGPYATLNCSLGSADDPALVQENRSLAAHALGANPARLMSCKQVHGAVVALVDEHFTPGTEADAMVTRMPGTALGVITADCAPVLLAGRDPAGANVVGAVHAGWRGAVAGVLEAAVAALRSLGATGTITAAIGPCIRQPSYEVGTDLRNAVLAQAPDNATFFAPGRPGHWQFDLAGYCAARLAPIGQVEVDVVEADTRADETRFFSHRRRTLAGGGPIGHQISIVVA